MVSIIIPTYNYAQYIADTLMSVKAQSYMDWECIIIDDGSKDNTREAVEQFVKQDNRFKYFYQENKGVSNARNSGVKFSRGEFIQFLDGDDLLQENKLNSQIECFETTPNADIVYNDVRFFNDGNLNDLKRSLKGDKKEDWLPKFSEKGASIVAQFSKINFIVMNAPLIRRTVFDKIGFFDENMKALEDWDFWMRCALEDCYFHFNSSQNDFALVRVHEGSLSTQKSLMNKGHFMFLRNCLAHKNLNFNYRLVLLIKYVELFWDSLLSKGYFELNPLSLALLSIVALPFYLILKIIRIVK